MQPSAIQSELLVDRIAIIMRSHLPTGISPGYFERFMTRHRRTMIHIIETRLNGRRVREADTTQSPPDQERPAELWTPLQRTQANLKAMALLARKQPEQLTDEDRLLLSQYSGWGGLSIEKVADRFPEGFPIPDATGLIHEYYSPSRITNEVALLTAPLLRELSKEHGTLKALEPSAGIGRFLRSYADLRRANRTLPLNWTAVELSPVSARLLSALFPNAGVYNMPFEKWLREHGAAQRGTFHLVVANPPYGPRGALIAEDSDKNYRVKQAYLYFLLRGLELLGKDGIGVFLIPAGFMTAAKFEPLRERVLKSQHLLTAYRLPSESPTSRDPIFPGANLVTDLLFFRARGGTLAEVLPDDRYIVEGRFYEAHPNLVLGQEYRGDLNDDHTARPRYRYAVIGEFNGLPTFEPRPLQTGLMVQDTPKHAKVRGGITRAVQELQNLPDDLRSAVQLGMRVDQFLENVARAETDAATQGYQELKRDLETWAQNHGNPYQKQGLLELSRRSIVGAERILSAFTRAGTLAEALATPPKHEPVYRGEPTLLGQADWLYRQQGKLTLKTAQKVAEQQSGQAPTTEYIIDIFTRAGWCLDGDDFDELVPESHYYSGDLWPRVDRVRRGLRLEVGGLRLEAAGGLRLEAGDLSPDSAQDPSSSVSETSSLKSQVSSLKSQVSSLKSRACERQLAQLLARIKPSVFEDILDGLSPREPWLPIEVVQSWVQKTLGESSRGGEMPLEREQGLLRPAGVQYDHFSKNTDQFIHQGYSEQVIWFIGWANHHLALFRPPQPREIVDGVPQKVPLDEVRLEVAEGWIKSFADWLRAHPELQPLVETAYNRTLRGFVAPEYPGEAFHIARWGRDTRTNGYSPLLFDYQWQAARRILANRCGLLAFDVGLGKTYTGLAILARARQEGWARRPVVVVPNSIVWKWHRDFARCLPDYQVLVIGSKRKVLTSGKRKGRLAAETDTPQERAEKWSAFQAGRADVVLLTYSALGRTRVAPELLYEFVDEVAAIQRQITLARAKARAKKGLSERQEATLQQTVEGWVAERLEANAGWEYDPGIEWHSLGIDYLMVDESQNFKNLFMPEEREGGVPDAMGGTEESKRAWQLDFRCASVRKHSGGAGVVLLSATPAKNGPVEFYNALHLINPTAWDRVGITDPEAFIDRYCAFEAKTAVTPDGRLTVRQACTAFKNLHELRDVIFRYADFKTAEDVGLRIPDAENSEHRVDLDTDQVEAIRAAWEEIKDVREQLKKLHGEQAARMKEALRLKIMGIAMRVDLIAIHPRLPDASKLTRAQIAQTDPHSGKIDALVEEIMATNESTCSKEDPEWCLSCGHVIFVENIAVHTWVKRALVEAGIPENRIAILNADVAADPETRQQLAERFNGLGSPGDEEYEVPEFDIVIANSVAYEGVDLQRRTCAIHHLDLPWDPATLQQRNGRGVRQGNKFQRVRIHYYLGRPSGDGRRLALIDKKRSWMSSLVKGQARVTNNPAATVHVSVEDILLDIVPPAERARVLREREEEAKRFQEQQKQRARIGANKLLVQANARFRRAEMSPDPAEAGRLRQEGEGILADLAKIDAEAWPWLPQAQQVREHSLWIPEEGPALRPGMKLIRFGQPVELGALTTDEEGVPVLGIREAAEPFWDAQPASAVDVWAAKLTAEDLIPKDFPTLTPELAIEAITAKLRWAGWAQLGFRYAPQSWLEQWWPQLASAVLKGIANTTWRNPWVPAVVGGRLRIAYAYEVPGVLQAGEALPPTEVGWRRFLALAPSSGHRFTELEQAGQYWWGRRIPRELLSASRRTGEQLAALHAPIRRRIMRTQETK